MLEASSTRRNELLRRLSQTAFVLSVVGAPILATACADDTAPEAPSKATTGEVDAPKDGPDASVTEPAVVDVDDYCGSLCDRVKECDASFDRQTCVRECKSESGVITNLNPELVAGLYECVEATSCSAISTERFVATCLADAAESSEPDQATRDFCTELANASDECSFTDYDQRACWRVGSVFDDEVLESALICVKKECDLIVDCLDATMKVPSELDGTPIGFEEEVFSSGNAAGPASAAFLPDTAYQQPASNASTQPAGSSPAPTPETDTPTTTNTLVPIVPPPGTSTPDDIDVSDPETRELYCNDEEVCTDCVAGSCCDEILTCLTTEGCVEWIGCVSDCAIDDLTCEDDCRDTYAAGEDAAYAYIECFIDASDGACSDLCSVDPDPTGTGTSTESSVTHPPVEDSSNDDPTDEPTTSGVTPEQSTETCGADCVDSGVQSCGDCLNAQCDAEVSACFDDDPCYYVYVFYAYCVDASANSEEFSDCFAPYYDYYATYEPDSVAMFETMNDCIVTADCPVCD